MSQAQMLLGHGALVPFTEAALGQRPLWENTAILREDSVCVLPRAHGRDHTTFFLRETEFFP